MTRLFSRHRYYRSSTGNPPLSSRGSVCVNSMLFTFQQVSLLNMLDASEYYSYDYSSRPVTLTKLTVAWSLYHFENNAFIRAGTGKVANDILRGYLLRNFLPQSVYDHASKFPDGHFRLVEFELAHFLLQV